MAEKEESKVIRDVFLSSSSALPLSFVRWSSIFVRRRSIGEISK